MASTPAVTWRAAGAQRSLLAERVRSHGVALRLGTQVAGFDVGRDGRIAAVRVAGGDSIPCDAALVAIGAEPSAELARAGCALAADRRTSCRIFWSDAFGLRLQHVGGLQPHDPTDRGSHRYSPA